MAAITVGLSDAKLSTDPAAMLVTHALGSCIGVAVYDTARKIGGLLHFQLPQSKAAPSSEPSPFKYADTGFNALLDNLLALGATKGSVAVKITGGAHKSSGRDSFNIGKRNYMAIRQILWKKGMYINAQDVGGSIPRTIYFHLADGSVTIKSQGKTINTL